MYVTLPCFPSPIMWTSVNRKIQDYFVLRIYMLLKDQCICRTCSRKAVWF
jgi:hypothetical protein